MIDFETHNTDLGTLVIRVAGGLDHDSNEYFFKCVKDEIEAGNSRIVINLAGVGHVSSVGLGSLLRARSRVAKAGGTICLARIESQVLEAFRLVNFGSVFNIFETEGEAIAAIEKGI